MIVNGLHAPEPYLSDALFLGDGLFESLRTYANRPFALELHLERMALGIKALGLKEPDWSAIRAAVGLLLEKEPFESGALRISFYSDGNWFISHRAYLPPIRPLNCRTISVELGEISFKSASYQDRIALRRAAERDGFDDSIAVNSSGELVELSTSNIIIQVEGSWYTPHLASGALPGVTRGLLLENFDLREKRLLKSDFASVEAAAAISSLREIHPIQAIDGKDLSISNELRALQESFHAWILGKLAL